MQAVPTIDLAAARAGDPAARKAAAAAIDEACRYIGFLVIRGHGIEDQLIADLRRAALAFFDLPIDEKRRLMPPAGTLLRGYTPPETGRLAASRGVETPPDFREMLSCGRPGLSGEDYTEHPDAAQFYQPNIWPAQPALVQPAFEAYVRAMLTLARELMQLFALALGLPEDFFDRKIDRCFSALHALHYAAQEKPPLPGQLRAGAHSDFGSLTILKAQKGDSGLEVLTPAGSWERVTAPDDAFVINIGDLMQRWTSNRWVSTMHRVINPPADASGGWRERRLSVGFFCHPNFDAEVACLPSCLAAGDAPLHPPILAGHYMRDRILAVRRVSAASAAAD